MTYQDLIDLYGSQAAAAQAIGTDRQRVFGWKDKRIPIEAQIEIELKTNGILRADLPPEVRNSEQSAA